MLRHCGAGALPSGPLRILWAPMPSVTAGTSRFPRFPRCFCCRSSRSLGSAPGTPSFGCSLLDLAPALLFVVLRFLRESERSGRSERDDLLLTTLFAIGSVYYFVAAQGTVWFAAHVVATALICLYLLCSFGARRPAAAGSSPRPCIPVPARRRRCSLGFSCFRRSSRGKGRTSFPPDELFASPSCARSRCLRFHSPSVVSVAMWHNAARFGDPFEFGHRFLQIRWRSRIETWGLFSTHYLPRNLTVFFLSVPWLIQSGPFIRITRHGLALWFTTPNLLWSLWPRKLDATIVALWAAVLPTAVCTLLYQNTGWVQFGYRFSLDYLPLLFVLVALSRRRFGVAFLQLCRVRDRAQHVRSGDVRPVSPVLRRRSRRSRSSFSRIDRLHRAVALQDD